MNTIDRELELLCSAPGCASQGGVVEQAIKLLTPLVDEIEQDALGNILAVRHAESSEAKTVLLEAHMDEIGFMVTSIDENGYLFVAPIGGVDKRTVATQPVVVYGKENCYNGVFCSVPPHLKKESYTLPEITDTAIDVGMDKETAGIRIPLGSRVGFAPNYTHLNGSVVSSKSLDNRCGMAAVLHCLRQLKSRRVRVAVSFSVQEELGCRGAAVAARKISPDYAVVTDVSFALSHDADARKCGRMRKGAMIGFSPVLDKQMSEQFVLLARDQAIEYQLEIMAETTGTDADVISVSGMGVRSALLSIPLRYMHTPVESVDLSDVKAVGDLMAAWIEWKGALADE
ncbi:MAG: M20/M25/M40 family metallo-hydrolase [Clostridia bacterium]|nr:M20/M25/M40 family metallo-hydrolase [Clostridia bacterium]